MLLGDLPPQSTENLRVRAARAFRDLNRSFILPMRKQARQGTGTGRRSTEWWSQALLSALVAAAALPFPLRGHSWEGNWFPRGTGRIPNISGLRARRHPVSCRQLPRSDSSLGPGQPRPLWWWWVGREPWWGLRQSIVGSSVFVCLSLRDEPLWGEVRLVGGQGERPVAVSEGWGRRGAGRRGAGEGEGQTAAPQPSSSS